MLSQELVDSLFPPDLPSAAHWQRRYPPRAGLVSGAEVTRFAPSPTGWLHIGGVFTASVDQDVAHHSGGVYVARIEDTDQSRFDPEAAAQFQAAFDYFGIEPDEGGEKGDYGPYTQSLRGQVYLTYVRELMR